MRGMRTGGILTALAAAALVLAAAPAQAQEPADTLRDRYMLQMPATVPLALTAPRTPPGSSAGSPTAFGANWGQGFAGAGFQGRARYVDAVDGTAAVGFGLGNARDAVGLEVAITTFSTFRSGFFNHGGLSLKAHRVFPNNVGIAVGWENALDIGRDARRRGDGTPSLYAVASQVVELNGAENPFSMLTGSLGIGGGRFQSERAVLEEESGVGIFASIGVRVMEPVSVIADWTGQDLALAASISPFRTVPIVITPALVDITGAAGDGARFTLGIGAGFQFADIRDALIGH